MTDTLLVPLSALDQNGVETSSITLGYVLKSSDNAMLEAAGKRMVNKWRLLAGRLEWSKDLSTWCIRVPLIRDVSDRLKFTTGKLSVPLDTPITPLDQGSLEILVRPSLKFFRHSSTPSSLSAFSSSNAPIVSIHVTELTNCTCVGVSVPHGVFDAFGIGQVIKSLDAELNGRPWSPPVSSEINIMREALKDLALAAPLYTKEPTALADIQREFVGTTMKNIASFGVGIAYEYLWKNAEVKAVYLGKGVVRDMIEKVKDEVKKSGTTWVSTGDVLVAWFLKAAFGQERDTSAVCVSAAISIRSPLTAKNPAFEDYTHNAIMPCSWPTLSKVELASKSLAELALLNRQNINAVRNVPFIQAYNHWVATIGGNGIPTRRRGADSLIFSNQVVGHFDKIDFGSEMTAFWHWNAPIIPDHSIILNKFKGGYIIEAGIRRSRWNAVAEEVTRMKKL